MSGYRTYTEYVCAQCGVPFTRRSDTKQQFCSRGCQGLARRRPVGHNETACRRCGATIYAPPSEVALGKAKYCNRACQRGTPEQRLLGCIEKSPEPDGCWRWTGATISRYSLYGRLQWEGRQQLAHRVAYMFFVGPIPDGQIIRHRCPGGEHAWCVNPAHLKPGTHTDNMRDVFADGRHWSQTGAWRPKKRYERPEDVPESYTPLTAFLAPSHYRTLKARADELGLDIRVYASQILKAAI